MTLIPAIVEYLKAQTAISALVDDRINNEPGAASHHEPRLVLQLISGAPERHMTAQSGIALARVQVNCWAKTERERALLAAAVYGEMGGHPGATMGSGDIATHVRSVTLENEGELFEESDGGEDHVVGRRMDFMVWYERTVPTFA